MKTYKIFIGGAFPRSESGRTYPAVSANGDLLAHAVLSSRKDVREAVKAARAAQKSWASRTAYNRGQILYRIAEMMDSRKDEFIREVSACVPFANGGVGAGNGTGASSGTDAGNSTGADDGSDAGNGTGADDGTDANTSSDANSVPNASNSPDQQAVREVETATDRWIWYAGWCDKFASVGGSSNPVAGPYFGFTIPEPTGVVGIVAPDEAPLASLISRLAPVLVSGNTAVVLASEAHPLPAIALAEVLATSDVPGGVVNILTGHRKELTPPLASHADVDALDLTGCDLELLTEARASAAATATRAVTASASERQWLTSAAENPYIIEAFCEYKTVWHPKGA